MRKLLIAILLLIPSLGWADDRLAWHGGVMSSGAAEAPPACTLLNDSDLGYGIWGADDTTDDSNNASSTSFLAVDFTPAANDTITSYTTLIGQFESPAGTATMGLQLDNAGVPSGSYISGTTVVKDPTTFSAYPTPGTVTWDLATPYQTTASTKYYLVLSTSGDATTLWYALSSVSGSHLWVKSGTWTAYSGANKAKIMGCHP